MGLTTARRGRRVMLIVAATGAGFVALWVLLTPIDYVRRGGASGPPFFLVDPRDRPEQMLTSLIAREGGLPKCCRIGLRYDGEELDIWSDDRLPEVASWAVDAVEVHNRSLAQELDDGEFAYSVVVLHTVKFVDGDEVEIRWESWRPGVTLGPVVIDLGSGPPGDLIVGSRGGDGVSG